MFHRLPLRKWRHVMNRRVRQYTLRASSASAASLRRKICDKIERGRKDGSRLKREVGEWYFGTLSARHYGRVRA